MEKELGMSYSHLVKKCNEKRKKLVDKKSLLVNMGDANELAVICGSRPQT